MYNITDATQEALAPVEIWRTMVQSVIGRNYILISNRAMGAIQITVFARVEVIYGISHLTLSHVPCGIGNVMVNKGGVGVSFRIYGTSFAFVAAHLPAHQNKVLDRNAAFHRIDYLLTNALIGHTITSEEAASPPILPSNETHLGNTFDHVFFMGDFNYRMDFPDYGRFMQMLNVIKASEKKDADSKNKSGNGNGGGNGGGSSNGSGGGGDSKIYNKHTSMKILIEVCIVCMCI